MIPRVIRGSSFLLTSALAVLLLGCGANRLHLSHELDEQFDEDVSDAIYESNTPSAYADRWGEPDEWRDEKVDSVLQSTMVWYCVEGERREMVWRLFDETDGRRRWVVVSEETSEGDCP